MKAIVFYQHGGPEVLRYEEILDPVVSAGKVMIQIKSAAINRLDIFVREGWPGLKLAYPHIPGADAAGVVIEVGNGVGNFVPGDRVVVNPTIACGHCEFCMQGRQNLCVSHSILGEFEPGTYTEKIVVPATNLLKIPDEISFAEAAAFSLVGLTAWHMLITRGKVGPGEDVLVVGAAGGVNSAAIQIAKLAGARVLVVGSNADKLDFAQSLGADVLFERKRENWSKAVFELTNKRGVDVVVDNVGRKSWRESIRALCKGGRMLIVGSTSGPQFDLDIRYIFVKQISIIGSTMGNRDDFGKVMRLLFEGKLKASIGKTLPLSEGRQAQEWLSTGKIYGKIVLNT